MASIRRATSERGEREFRAQGAAASLLSVINLLVGSISIIGAREPGPERSQKTKIDELLQIEIREFSKI